MDVPQDVIDTIIDIVGQTDDKKTLSVLSLVCRSFLPQSRKSLFATIHLTRTGHRNRWRPYYPIGRGVDILGRRLFNLLQSSPHLFQYIRTLKMYAWSTSEFIWMTQEDEAVSIIRACTRLQAFEFGSEVEIRWPMMNPSLQSSLEHLMYSPQLQSLTLLNVKSIPTLLLLAFGSRTTLRLEEISFVSHPPDSESTVTLKRDILKSLSVAVPNPVLQLMLDHETSQQMPSLDLSQLLVLDLAYGSDGKSALLMDNLLRRTTHLQELHVSLLQPVVSTLREIHVQNLMDLRRISLLTEPQFLRDAYSFIEGVIQTPSIEHAEVMCSLLNGPMQCLEAMQIWEQLQPRPPFQQLKLRFFLPQTGDPEDINYFSRTDDFFTKLHSAMNGNLLNLITQSQVQIMYDILSSDDEDAFRTEMLDIRRRAIARQRNWSHVWTPPGP
ncbi:hypothetical protein BDZ97DRAFT_1917540 [Flammula alnicola]|nr:hypothetical protein BDZ97DRAFT_1917540 [Flammula alnicola]